MQTHQQQYESLVPDSQAMAELGGVTSMTFWRWDNNPDKAPLGWQRPVKLGRRNFRTRSMIEAVKASLLRQALEARNMEAA